jgi:RNA polymerase sigma-70 factor, ECF subfamily
MEKNLKAAISGDIVAFQQLFAEFQPQLKSYLYRLLTDRNDTDDLTHDTFVKAFDKIATFKGESSLKTWVFQIATNLAYDFLKKYKRWQPDAQDQSKAYAMSHSFVAEAFFKVSNSIGEGAYEMTEHIDFCFTCISKALPIEQQIALILKEMYDFSVKEIMLILDKKEGVVKHLLIDSRKTMSYIFDQRCALINKNGVCNQCSELNGVFNPKQNQQAALMQLDLVKASKHFDREELYDLRIKLAKNIDPVRGKGADLQDLIMKCTRTAIGEIPQSAFLTD